MLFSLGEIIDVVIMTLIIGYIFQDLFRGRTSTIDYDPLKSKKSNQHFWYAAISIGFSIVFHELGHKFIAIALGLEATFHAAYTFLGLGLLLKLMNFGFIFLVPAYVSHSPTTPINGSMIAFAGPATNLIIYLLCSVALTKNLITKKYYPLIHFTKYINGFLFIVNMIPIPGLDGYWVFKGIFA